MTNHGDNTRPMQEINHSFQDAVGRLPAYKQILPFFETVYTLQEAAVSTTRPDAITMTPELLQAKLEGQFPLMDRQQVHTDLPAAMRLLKALIAEVDQSNDKMRDAAATIKSTLESDGDAIERGFHLVMTDDSEGLERLGNQIGVDKDLLTFFLYNSLFPSIAQHERSLSTQHHINDNQDKGSCPICGGMPDLSFLSESGQRFLACGFCRHQWPIKRILCPHCGCTDTEAISYFFVEEEKAYRVYTCDACKTYIKTVDTRELSRVFFPPLEGIITTHLDLHAQQMGYQSTADSGLPEK